MLGMISQALDDALAFENNVGINNGINVGITNEAEAMLERLLLLVRENPSMTIKQMASELGKHTSDRAYRLQHEARRQARSHRSQPQRSLEGPELKSQKEHFTLIVIECG